MARNPEVLQQAFDTLASKLDAMNEEFEAAAESGRYTAAGLDKFAQEIDQTWVKLKKAEQGILEYQTAQQRAAQKQIEAAERENQQRAAASRAFVSQLLSSANPVVAVFNAIVGSVSRFVEAFNPAILEVMNQAFRDLNATIGYALEPVIQIATEVLREFAGAMRAGFDALRPVIATIASAIMPAFSAVIQAAGESFAALAQIIVTLLPAIQLAAKVFEGIVTIGSVLYRIFSSLVESLFASFGLGELSSVTEGLHSAFVELGKAIISAVDWLLRLVGLGTVADRVLRALAGGPRPEDRRIAAPRDIQLGSAEDVYRRRLTEAAKAGGGASPLEKQVSIMEDIRKHTQQLLAQGGRGLENAGNFFTRCNAWANQAEAFGRGVLSALAGPGRWLAGLLPGRGR